MAAGPFCELCIASGSPCASCQSRIGSDASAKLLWEVSSFVFKNKDKLALNAVKLLACFDDGHAAVVVTDSDPGLLIGKGGRIAEQLARSLNRRVKIIGRHAEMHSTASELLSPVRLLGIKEVFSQSGKYFKIRIAKRDAGRLPASRETITDALGFVYSGQARIAIE